MIIAIDGYSSSGKSTFAKAIARELDLTYIDSGAMYRAVTLFALEQGMIRGGEINERDLTEALSGIDIQFRYNNQRKRHETCLNNVNVEDRIRMQDVSACVSPVSKIPAVREKLVQLQRSFARHSGVVMDGRDIGTVVFPDADIKIFLVSDPDTRAGRRHRELREKGHPLSLEEIKSNIMERDRLDSTRDISPLKKPDGALELDNTYLTVEQQMEWFRGIMRGNTSRAVTK